MTDLPGQGRFAVMWRGLLQLGRMWGREHFENPRILNRGVGGEGHHEQSNPLPLLRGADASSRAKACGGGWGSCDREGGIWVNDGQSGGEPWEDRRPE